LVRHTCEVVHKNKTTIDKEINPKNVLLKISPTSIHKVD